MYVCMHLGTYACTYVCMVSTIPLTSLCQIFSSPPSTTQRALMRGLYAMFIRLLHLHPARIQWPTIKEMEEYSVLVSLRESCLNHVFGFVDGVWIPIQEPPNPDVQNAYYNG